MNSNKKEARGRRQLLADRTQQSRWDRMRQTFPVPTPRPRIRGSQLLEACRKGSYELVHLLLRDLGRNNGGSKGIDLNKTDWIGHAPLETAITMGHTRIAKLLIEHGADVTHSRRYDGSTPLHSALIHERNDIVKLLLSHGSCCSTINQSVNNGFTPLHIACSNGNAEIAYMLLQNGASIEARDARDWTPLFMASWRGHVNVIRHLITFGANVNACDMYGQTPISLACQRGHVGVALLLLEHGAMDHTTFGGGKHRGIVKTLSLALKSMTTLLHPSFVPQQQRRSSAISRDRGSSEKRHRRGSL